MMNLLTEKCLSSHWLNFHQKMIKQRMEKKVDSRYFRDGAVKKPYSPKTLSNKKSSASLGIRRELPSTSHLVQYRGTHPCTRQGRLRELHIRVSQCRGNDRHPVS
uniref:SFI1 centrin binding protein n=1 Tax=Saimiri boliviensis boliviensis TaxID=39432 RepID=A0A2K6V6N7_SAIBB